MTDKVDPSVSSDGQAYMVAQAIQQHGAVGDGWIVPDTDSYAADHATSGVTGAPLGAFAKTAESGLDVTFDSGEAFIGGSWVARDAQTTVTLADDTTDQTVVVGWDYNEGDAVKIGVPGETPGDTFDAKDPRVPLYTFDTAGGSVTSETDERQVDKSIQVGAAGLESGTSVAQFLMTAVSEATQGTPGDSSGELWRAGSGTSDLLMSVRGAGSDRMNLVWNAYYDGSDWRHITGGEQTYRLVFANDGIELLTAGTDTADAIVSSWDGVRVDAAGALYDAGSGTQIYDDASEEVPQGQLGGAASSLGTYPVPASDIADGAGSSLDADTVDGQHASEISTAGEWTPITTETFDDPNTDIDYDTGQLGTVYDVYEVGIVIENQEGHGTFVEAGLQVNGDARSSYRTTSVEHTTEVTISQDLPRWTNLAKSEKGEGSVGTAVARIHTDVTGNLSDDRWPVMSARSSGWVEHPQAVFGQLEEDHAEINQFRIISRTAGRDATGVFHLKGKNY